MQRWGFGLAFAIAVHALGCVGDAPAVDDDDFTSAHSKLVDFTFDGEVVAASSMSAKAAVRAQLLYTVGHINAEPGVAELPKLVLEAVSSAAIGGGLSRITYRAKLPVAWGKSRIPATYTFTLPRRIGSAAEEAFVASYRDRCADDPEAANASNYWYHYRPNQGGCALASDDIVRVEATTASSPANTTGKYPEYARIWEDGALRIVAIFGKYEEGATDNSDAGIRAYQDFVARMRDVLRGAVVTPTATPGPNVREVSFELPRDGGTRVDLSVLLVDKLATEGAAFDRRYAELSTGADVILYSGHAGLGGNVRALMDKGKFFPGKYQIFFFNGCDTFAYIDETLARRRAELNPDDPSGTRHMDVVANAMPAYFDHMADGATALVRALLTTNAPRSYEAIFRDLPREQIVVVTGEQDNGFAASTPVMPAWSFSREGAVRKAETQRFETDVLAPGRYVFTLLPDVSIAAGDADLRVRLGTAPTITSEFKCPSFVANSNERCVVDVTSAARVHVAVTGDSAAMASPYALRAFRIP
jgi:hypothetical protein